MKVKKCPCRISVDCPCDFWIKDEKCPCGYDNPDENKFYGEDG